MLVTDSCLSVSCQKMFLQLISENRQNTLFNYAFHKSSLFSIFFYVFSFIFIKTLICHKFSPIRRRTTALQISIFSYTNLLYIKRRSFSIGILTKLPQGIWRLYSNITQIGIPCSGMPIYIGRYYVCGGQGFCLENTAEKAGREPRPLQLVNRIFLRSAARQGASFLRQQFWAKQPPLLLKLNN